MHKCAHPVQAHPKYDTLRRFCTLRRVSNIKGVFSPGTGTVKLTQNRLNAEVCSVPPWHRLIQPRACQSANQWERLLSFGGWFKDRGEIFVAGCNRPIPARPKLINNDVDDFCFVCFSRRKKVYAILHGLENCMHAHMHACTHTLLLIAKTALFLNLTINKSTLRNKPRISKQNGE